MTGNYLLAVPAFNEEAHLPAVLAAARCHAEQVLVVDDGSTDATPRLLAATPNVHVIRHPANLGYGRSLADAFRFAIIRDFDGLITMDCDEQHEPACIPQFAAALAEGDFDLISGTRYLRAFPGDSAPPPDRRAINRRITTLLNGRLGLALTDAFCGFKAYRVSALRDLRITDDGYAMPLQLWVQAVWLNWRMRELPIPRVYGEARRGFGQGLDDPRVRLAYYREVFEREYRLCFPQGRPRSHPAPATCAETCGADCPELAQPVLP